MIIFDLKCAPGGHVFEAWFASSDSYEEQRARGLVSCPLCGKTEVEKAPMAPAVGAKGNAAPKGLCAAPAEVKAMLAAAATAQREMLAGSESVGTRFPAEALAIHLGEAPARPIHGQATPAQAGELAAEGVPIAALPFPVVAPGEEN
jgi:hypothetical protein